MYFFKYNQLGNDFLLIDDRQEKFPVQNKDLIRFLTHRKFGIGSDGIILLQNSKTCDYRFRIFNADGSEAESCGNGLCCFTHFLREMQLITSSVCIELVNSVVKTKIENEKVTVHVSMPEKMKQNQQFILNKKKIAYHYVNTGVPHLVLFVEDVNTVDFELAKKMRNFCNANVNFVQIPSQAKNRVQARVYERGVEKETLGCGTGALAVALASSLTYAMKEPISVRYPGGELAVYLHTSEAFLIGTPKKVFTGDINLKEIKT